MILSAALAFAATPAVSEDAPKPCEAAATMQASRTKWEYKVTDSKEMGGVKNIESALNKMGEEGWEVVTMNVTSSGLTFTYLFLLKRPA
jgi:hypothetical protein